MRLEPSVPTLIPLFARNNSSEVPSLVGKVVVGNFANTGAIISISSSNGRAIRTSLFHTTMIILIGNFLIALATW